MKSHLIFRELGRSSQLKCRETTYSRLYFHEWEFSRKIFVPQKFRTIRYACALAFVLAFFVHSLEMSNYTCSTISTSFLCVLNNFYAEAIP